MKRLTLALLVSTAAVGSAMSADLPAAPLAVAPAYAEPLFDAYFGIGAGYGWNSFDSGGVGGSSVDNNGFALQGRATFEAAITNRFGAQADGVLGRDWNSLSSGGVTIDDPTTTATLAGHLFWRDPGLGLIGAIGQYTNQNTDLKVPGFSVTLTNEHYYAGAEAQYFFNNVTLYGQAAYHSSTIGLGLIGAGTSIDGDGVTLAGQLRYFVSPDFVVALKGDYDHLKYTSSLGPGSLNETSWTAGLHSEYRLASMPVSIYGDLTYGQNRWTSPGVVGSLTEKDTRAMVGIKYNFGTRTLQERDRAGASLDPFESHFSFPFF